jgi:hypothetical protein
MNSQRNLAGRVGRCSKCGEPSYLRIVMPSEGHPAYDEQLFACRSCGYAETLFVRIGTTPQSPATVEASAPVRRM